MSFMFPKAPAPPPPPPNPETLASPTIMESAAAERETLASARGQNAENPTGGQGVKTASTTKSLLGG